MTDLFHAPSSWNDPVIINYYSNSTAKNAPIHYLGHWFILPFFMVKQAAKSFDCIDPHLRFNALNHWMLWCPQVADKLLTQLRNGKRSRHCLNSLKTAVRHVDKSGSGVCGLAETGIMIDYCGPYSWSAVPKSASPNFQLLLSEVQATVHNCFIFSTFMDWASISF